MTDTDTSRPTRNRFRNSRKPRKPASIPTPAAAQAPILFPKTDKQSVICLTIGGIGSIGCNWTAYGHAGRWILVDCGAGMPPKGVAGLQVVVPDPAALKPMLSKLSAIVVTHAHYDHIGGLPALAQYVPKGTRIYATKFTAECVRNQIDRYDSEGRYEIRTFSPFSNLNIGPFSLVPIRVAHSSPEALAFGIVTPAARILHTGDWRIDEEPNTTWKTDFAAIGRFAKQGVDAMIADSTCADRSSPAPSEATISANFAKFLERQEGMVAAACFSSHVDRIAGMIQAATVCGRTVFVAGRSLVRTLEAAVETGILDDRHKFETDLRMIDSLHASQVLLVCTGTQGEDNAVLRRLADDDRKLPALYKGDSVVFSARCIPGNEEEVETVVRILRERDVEVFQGEGYGLPLHASGHASRPEIETMLAAARPKALVPVHGTDKHFEAHVEIARNAGVASCVVTANGRALRISADGIVEAGDVHLRHMAGVLRNGRLVLKPLEVAVAEAQAAALRSRTYRENRPHHQDRVAAAA